MKKLSKQVLAKVSKLFISMSLVLGMIVVGGVTANPVLAIETRSDESMGVGASAFLSKGSKSYSTYSLTQAEFTVKSNEYQSGRLYINITVKNGRIKLKVDGETYINADNTEKTATIDITGTERTFVFVPYTAKLSGYTINSLSAK